MKTYDVYVTELWTRRYTIEAESEEDAIERTRELEQTGAPGERRTVASDPEFESTFEPDGTGPDAGDLAWTAEVRE